MYANRPPAGGNAVPRRFLFGAILATAMFTVLITYRMSAPKAKQSGEGSVYYEMSYPACQHKVPGLTYAGTTCKGDCDQTEASKRGLVVVTAADWTHWNELQNLLGSLQFWEPHIQILVYDLGLTRSQVTELKGFCNVAYKQFDFENYPEFVSNLKFYAWKPLIVKKELDRHAMMLWLDAGVELRNTLDVVVDLIVQDGYFTTTADSLCKRTAAGMWEYLGISATPYCESSEESLPMCSMNMIGLRRNSDEVYLGIIIPWVNCALYQNCIAPPGHTKGHRFDQAAFSVLLTHAAAQGKMVMKHSNICETWQDSKGVLGTYAKGTDGNYQITDEDPTVPLSLVLNPRRHVPPHHYVERICRCKST